ncbi:MAG: bifunctional riboflavin kinase/FAD synthetase [Lachnospiraceae bacterium]|nr:bifunctional riboflavin kinase/FAD synthetase [Lachnospiraceae bacterium]
MFEKGMVILVIKFCNTTEFNINGDTAVVLGKFDGIHRGHQKLLEEVKKYKKLGLKIAVFTFHMPISSFFTGVKGQVLTTNIEKEEYLADLGVHYLIEYPVNGETVVIEPEAFIKDVLVDKLHAKILVAGPDCSFGYKGRGNFALLKEYGKQLGFKAVMVDKVYYEEREISSTFVREEVEAGRMEMTSNLLGRPYSVSGKVMHGRKLGRQLNMPTVNLLPDEVKLLPPFGVYYSEVIVGTRRYDGISNIGRKPTISDSEKISVETYLYDFSDDLYGEQIRVELLSFARSEQKFASVQELKEKLKEDLQKGEEFRLRKK